MSLSRAAERAVSAAARRQDVAALRVVAVEPAQGAEGHASGPALVVRTGPAGSLGRGEVVINQGAAALYVPTSLLEHYRQAIFDLHDPHALDEPRLVLRVSAAAGRSSSPGKR